MSAIGPGDWVRCVDASCDPWGRPVPLVAGEAYMVTAVWEGMEHAVLGTLWLGMAFDLHEVERVAGPDGEEHAWGAYRFRPMGENEATQAREMETA